MINKLMERKKLIEEEIFIIECADRLSYEERKKLNELNHELLKIQSQIEKVN